MAEVSPSQKINQFIDHTLLRPNAQSEDFAKLCDEAKLHQFMAVCVPPNRVGECGKWLEGSKVQLATVVGFPLGYTMGAVKIREAQEVLSAGADEVDMVIAIGLLKDRETKAVESEIAEIKKIIGAKILKVIIETSLLTDEEKVLACKIASSAGADFVKTSTGFSGGGATIEDVKLMRQSILPAMQVKASGGIRTREFALQLIASGATRLGTSSGAQLIAGQQVTASY